MTSLDFTKTELKNLITHYVGNKLRDENIQLSEESTSFPNETKDFILRYFLLPLKAEELYSFTHSLKLEMNNLYSIVSDLFSRKNDFINNSKNIAKLLYESSMHPKIKGGELNIAYFSNIVFNNEVIDAVGIYKSETDVPFLKMKIAKSKYNITHDYGYQIKGVDKGCIIFNTKKESGYNILVIDNSNKSSDAKYWKDDFLQLKQITNEFHETTQFLGITKNFVSTELDKEFEISKADKIELLNRSIKYFKTNENYKKKEFEKEVFQDLSIIKSFEKFKKNYTDENEIKLKDNFEISQQAVKKQIRVFKSVLKLDKNFHIYIHGNRHLIEKGIEKNGRKFYKIYYDNET